MYVENVGIIYWSAVRDSEILQGGQQETLRVADTMFIAVDTIPETRLQIEKSEHSAMNGLESQRVGKVKSHVVLEEYIVFITELDKVFCCSTRYSIPASDVREPVELFTFSTASPSKSFEIRDLQGAFRRFAVFTRDGRVLTATQDLLHAFWNNAHEGPDRGSQALPFPTIIPSLQNNGIISMAFGDYHYHALRDNGTVVTFGKESYHSGALGLNDYGSPMSKLRGVIGPPGNAGSSHLPEGEGRTVWFEPMMAIWLEDMWHKIALDGEKSELGIRLKGGDEGVRKACADYFEKEGARWEENVTGKDDMGAYSVLKVAAGGWSSAALILVDEEKVKKAQEAHMVQPLDDQSSSASVFSAQSNGSYEEVDSPGEQLSKAVLAALGWVRKLGRAFLGLTARDRRNAQKNQRGRHAWEGNHAGYVWDKALPPILELRDGKLTVEDTH